MTETARKAYRLLTSPDTAEFWVPVMAYGPDGVVVGQAVVLPDYMDFPKAETR